MILGIHVCKCTSEWTLDTKGVSWYYPLNSSQLLASYPVHEQRRKEYEDLRHEEDSAKVTEEEPRVLKARRDAQHLH